MRFVDHVTFTGVTRGNRKVRLIARVLVSEDDFQVARIVREDGRLAEMRTRWFEEMLMRGELDDAWHHIAREVGRIIREGT